MELNYYMIIITNLCIAITFLFSIILIIDELFNIGFFTFNYTYQFNYGSFTSKFNNLQTIECETNRFNVYNNINFLFKDIFNKSYFNYLLTIVATLITILCSIAYAVYFYYKFIIEQPEVCTYEDTDDLSLPKQLLKCLCDECHKLIPNCTTNYFIVFIILIIIPLSYIFKTMFNINFTPNSDNILFNFIYICLFILLIFYYSFNLFTRKSENKYNDLIIYSLFTIIFISSGYIYKYIISKYNNINLNTSNDITTFYDIYKQAPPLKPKPIQKPMYKGIDLLTNFKYNDKESDPDYKIKKTIVDDYYKSIKNFDNDMKYYNQRFNTYNSSLTSTKLSDKTDFIDISINILGLNNYMHIYIIILLIISLIIYSIFNDDISYVCFIYLLVILISLTVMNSILYYNTYINKYIIYEPLAHYKTDIINANTALNIELNPSSGNDFYKKLINNDIKLMDETNSDVKTAKDILEDIKKLTNIKNYTSEITSNINNNINTYNTSGSTIKLLDDIDKNIDNAIFAYSTSDLISKTNTECTTKSNDICYIIYANPVKYLLDNLEFIKSAFNNDIKIEKNKKITFKYSTKDIIVTIPMTGYYTYCYYMLYQYQYLLENRIAGNTIDTNMSKINNYKDKISNLISKLISYKTSNLELSSFNNYTINSNEGVTKLLVNNIDEFINSYIKKININILNKSQSNTSSASIPYLTVSNNVISISSTFTAITYNDDISYAYTFQNSTISDLYIAPNNFELPYKISDNNDEYILKLASNFKIYLYYNLNTDIITNYSYNSKYITSNTANNSITKIIDNKYALSNINTDYTIPFALIKKSSNNTNDKLKKIILAVLFNSICNIQSKFTSSKLFNEIRRYTGPTPIEFKSNENYIMKYNDKFTPTFISDTTKKTETLLLTDDYITFYILLLNAYHSTFIDIKKTINTNINYIMNNSYKLRTTGPIINMLNTIIDTKIFSEENINSNYEINKDDEIVRLYKQNKYIIDLIIALFENLLLKIKTEITDNKKYNDICFPPSTSILIIEDAIYNKFNQITTTIGSGNNYNNISKIIPGADTDTPVLIDKLNNYLKYYFNIVIFLLDNLKLNTNTAEIDTITTNFNFYNQDDIVKNTIQKQLTINCDYYNKYNNLDSKQLSYFKLNADNVNYNFPILLIVFIIVLGEPIFIKS